MITRYSISHPRTIISKRFEVAVPKDFKPIYNAHSGIKLPIITNDDPFRLGMYQWGIIPFNAQDAKISEKLLNARLQTINAKQPFCDLINTKRCILPMDGYFIWQEKNNISTPYRVTLKTDELFGVAGLWDTWKVDNEDSMFHTFTMITTPANKLTEVINDRMPAILPIGLEKNWIENIKENDVSELLGTFDAEKMRIYKVQPYLNDLNLNHKKVIKEENQPQTGETLNLFG